MKFDSDMRRIATLPRFPSVTEPKEKTDSDSEKSNPPTDKIDWRKELEPQGAETRLGQSVRQIINDERGAPISAVVVFSDGEQNAGVDVGAAIKAAQEAKIPVYTVALGSVAKPTNVHVSDLVAPARVYPGDAFQITGYLQSQGLNGRSVGGRVKRVGAESGRQKTNHRALPSQAKPNA